MSKLKLLSFAGLVVAIVTTLIILPACAEAEPEVVVETVTETVVETVTETVIETVTEELTTVRLAVAPYSMYFGPYAAKEFGFDKELGLDYEIKEYVVIAHQFKELIRGDLDIVATCIPEFSPFIKTAPEARIFTPLDLFKGFIFIGRAEDGWKPWDELVEEMGLEKAVEFRRNEFKGKSFLGIPFRFALINDMFSQIGLTDKDYTSLEYADDQLAAVGFISGDGDIYTGSLPQEIRLLKDFNGEYVNLGGQEVLGPMGLWYGNMATTEKFLEENREICLKYMAIQYRLNKLFYEDPLGRICEIYNDNLNRLTGSENTIEQYAELETVYDYLMTVEWAKENYFNPESPYYWVRSADYNIKVLVESGVLDEIVPAVDYMPQDDIFNELLSREDLMEFINKPLPSN